jgi:hypothetical protein
VSREGKQNSPSVARCLQPRAGVTANSASTDEEARHLDRDPPRTIESRTDSPRSRVFTPARVRAGASVAGYLLALAVTTYVFLILNRRFFYAGSGYDEEFFVWLGWCVRKGLAPYRDFVELKPPVLFLTHALAQTSFGVANFGYRKFFTVFPLVSLLAFQIALLARGASRMFATAVVLGIIALFVDPTWHDTALSDSESIGLAYYLLGLAFLLWEGRYIKATTALGGFFLGCCVMSKEPFLPPALATWIAFFWIRRTPASSRERSLLLAKYSLIGVGVLIVGLSIYMVPTGAMKAYVKQVISYVTIHRNPKTSYCSLNGAAQSRSLIDTWNAAQGTLLNERHLGFLVPFFAPGMVFVYRRSRILFGAVLLTLAAGVVAATASNCPWHHYYVMAMTGIVFALLAVTDSTAALLRARVPTLRRGLGIAALLVVGGHLGGDLVQERAAHHEREPWHPPAADLLPFIAANTVPSDRIFTTGTPMLYVQANRISAVRESSILDDVLGAYPGETDEQKLRPLHDELVRNKPKVVFIDPQFEERKKRHLAALVMPYLKQFNYKKINDRMYLRP